MLDTFVHAILEIFNLLGLTIARIAGGQNMHLARPILALLLLTSTGACSYGTYGSYYPNEGTWNAAAIERPQRVRFFYGYIVDVRRPVPVDYQPRAAFEPNWEPKGRYIIPVAQQYPPPAPVPLPPGYENPCPNQRCPGVEYTVMLDKATTPPDEFLQYGQHPALIVVQLAQPRLPKGARVVVRMVNNSAVEVMPATTLPWSVGGINVEKALSAGPLPIPLSYRPPPPEPRLSACGYDRPCYSESVSVRAF